MTRLVILPILLLTLLIGTSANATDLQKGLSAFNRKDYETALRLWKPLAEQGNLDAQWWLGWMYRNGDGTPKDYKTAFKYYKLAAEQGYTPAQYELGEFYQYGYGVTQNEKTAVKWYRLAAEQGLSIAQYNLGEMYDIGEGVIRDYVLAYMWYLIAVSQGSKYAKEEQDRFEKKMNPTQVAEAMKLARECVKRNYKGCRES